MDRARDLARPLLIATLNQPQQVQAQYGDLGRQPLLRERLRVVLLLGRLQRARIESRRGVDAAKVRIAGTPAARTALPGNSPTSPRLSLSIPLHRPRRLLA
jgi:hypothetical protein